ncbi:ATP synthase subunit a [Enhygromyxa salina]|uniref:ATP synthase subunit a n=1 Tax=Enhygromyxa salina TaxID=215803 RepID=A0A2S9XIN3_9BACT|nr:F0F1 ATP synthase subunit A [Enhygromyxa salina]PRP92590.1 ATP synthase subunit a [Enhygromyxa salina]
MNPVFTLRLFGLEIPDTIPVSLGLVALILVVAWLSARRLVVHEPSRWQVVLEIFVVWLSDTVERIMGEDPRPYVPLIGTLIVWIGLCNLLTAVPWVRPPTADLSTTVALALVVMIAVPGYGIWRHGVGGYLRTYLRPHPLLLPFNIIGELTRTLALAVRLFGNVMSGHMVGAVLLVVAGLLVPIPLVMLGLLTGMIQAYIFGILAAVFIAAAIQVDLARDQPAEPAQVQEKT